MKNKFFNMVLLATLMLFITNFCFPVEPKLVKVIYIDDGALLISGSFALIEDGKFIFTDIKDENCQLKIIDDKGKIIKSWGKMGPGPDEFGGLAVIDYQNPFLAIMDAGKRSIHIFKKGSDFTFQKSGDILAWEATGFIKLYEESIIMGGYIVSPKGKAYIIFSRDIKGNNTRYILPLEYTYGDNSLSKYRETRDKVSGVSYSGYMDVYKDLLFYVSDVRLKIIKVDLKTERIETIGKEPGNFIPLEMDRKTQQELLNTRTGKNVMEDILSKYSFVSGIFVDNNLVGVLYVNREKMSGNKMYFVPYLYLCDWKGQAVYEGKLEEFYTEEKEIPLFYEKSAGNLYLLSLVSDDSGLKYAIYQYHLNK